MALKYYFEFTDVQNILHRCEIYNDTFVGTATEVQGSLSLTKASTKDTLESIRGGGLQIDLEATNLLSFNDLYSENERQYSVKYIRNSTDLLFYGWLSPEGLIESFVDDTWIISLDCTDGLGFLTNLSYVENATGLTFSGKQSALEIIVNCLKRTNLVQNIYTSIDIYYTGMTTTQNVLANTYFNANRFIKDDNNTTIMNCEEVLRSILEPFGACITQYKGSWYIFKPNVLFDNTNLSFFAYDGNGVALPTPTVTVEFSQSLGSQINNFYPHHVNKNQQLTVDSSIGAYRINYKYGLVRSFIENKYLQSVSNTNIPGYNIINNTYLTIPFDTVNNTGVTILQNNTSIISVLETSNSIILPINQQFDFFMKYFIGGAFVFGQFEVILTGTSNTYYLKKLNLLNTSSNSRFYSSEWTQTQTYITAEKIVAGEENETISSEPLPEAGNIKVIIYTSDQSFGSSAIPFNLTELNITPNVTDDNLQGENHTFQIISNPSTKIEKTKEVFNGDNDSDIYVGTIYKSDETTPTETWTRGDSRAVPILEIMGEERMKMYAKPLRVFSGDVFGYIDYLSVISIDGINNVLFMPIEYEYNAETNITKLKLKQILNNLLPDTSFSNIDYKLTFDFGNVVEPTIKG